MKYVFYTIGILLLTLGLSLTIQSNLGTSPFDAVLVGLARNVGLTVGSWEIILAVLMIGSNSILIRKKPEILGVVTALVAGIGIDFWLFLLGNSITPELWPEKAVCFSVGLIVIGIGTAIYLHTNFAPIPVDRFTLILKELTRTNLFFSRTLVYLLFLMLAIIVDGPVGIGTVLTVCFGGLLLNFFMPPIGRALDSISMTLNKSPYKLAKGK